MEFSELKRKYGEFAGKYKLPSFRELNEDFEIGKIEHDSGVLLRAVRKVMMDKVVNSLGFVEMLLNPMNAPRLYLPFLQTMSEEDKKRIDRVYGVLGELSLVSVEREISYDEKKEADLINEIFERWCSLKEDFEKLLSGIRKPHLDVKKDRSYFG